jgi:hypothetical protein
MFRPACGEEHVDIAIITQLIASILEDRVKDGTDVFDSFGGGSKRKQTKPDEILIFCVDCSKSMEDPSDFEELAETDSEESNSEDGYSTDEGSDVVASHGSQDSPTNEGGSDNGECAGMTFGQMKGGMVIMLDAEVQG